MTSLTKKTTHHSHVGIAGKQFQVDLLVDHGLGVGVEIHADFGRHLDLVLRWVFRLER